MLKLEYSIRMKETWSEDDSMYAWQLQTITDKGRLLTDKLHTTVGFATGKGHAQGHS